MDRYHARLLPFAEWDRLDPALTAALDPNRAIIVVVENEVGDIVARWMAFDTVALEGLSIDPGYQKHPGVAARLLQAMTVELMARGVPQAITMITAPEVERLAERHGLTRAPGNLWVLDLRPLLEDTTTEERTG
jgi:ribosomal protein S18 acetylase RimI-like enzyme